MSDDSKAECPATGQGAIPRSIKLGYSVFLCVLVPVYWHHYGPANFLWGSDIALIFVFAAVWLESRLLNSMMAIGVMPFEIVWTLDFFSGSHLLHGTSYMFEESRPLYLRGLSLFHLMLPPIIIFLLFRLGYDRRALPAQSLLVWVILPVCYLVTDPTENINFVFGPGKETQALMHPLLYLSLEMLLLPLVICWPAHLMLNRFFNRRLSADTRT